MKIIPSNPISYVNRVIPRTKSKIYYTNLKTHSKSKEEFYSIGQKVYLGDLFRSISLGQKMFDDVLPQAN